MFKYISRFRASLYERGILSNRTSGTSDQGGTNVVIQDNKIKGQLPCPLRLVPCFLEACQRHLSHFNIQKNDEQHNNSSGRKNDGHRSTGDSFHSENINCHQPCAIIGAVGWSGVLVLGWSILQPWYRHSERRKPLVETDLKTDYVNRYAGLYKLLIHPALSQPVNHILPATVSKNDNEVQLSSGSATQESESKPLSPEEAFDEAAEEVRRVHERVVGEAENRRGVACLSHKRHREAIEHFRIASTFKNAPAAFNLGQCYELGIGTNQDFTQAAHWYKVASDMGHSTAMYNLGVFYAHGWGGLKADSRRARELFLTAAALGQPDAQAALNLSKENVNSDSKEIESNPDESESFESRLAFDFFKMNNISLKFTNLVRKRDDFKDLKDNVSNFKPDSSLPSSSSPSSALSSSPSSSSVSSTNEHPLMFHQQISTIEESSEDYSERSSEDEWQAAADVASLNGNSATLYRLAVCYENSRTVDPELILQLYRMAADHGHQRAKQRLKVLEEHYACGTLASYLKSIKKKSKYSSVANCSLHE